MQPLFNAFGVPTGSRNLLSRQEHQSIREAGSACGGRAVTGLTAKSHRSTLAATAFQWKVLASSFGLAAIWVSCCAGGAVVTAFLLWATDMFAKFGRPIIVLALANGIYLIAALPVGVFATWRLQRRALLWLRTGHSPSRAEASAIMHMPAHLAILSACFWLIGSAVNALTALAVLPATEAATAIALDALGALASAGLVFLLADRTLRPVIGPAVAVNPTAITSTSVMSRMVVAWAVSSWIPLLGLMVVLGYNQAAASHRITGAWWLAAVAIGTSVTTTATLARGVAAPLHEIRLAVGQISGGNLDTHLDIGSLTEVGLLQRSVNEMAQNLRERDRLTELFGQHVGTNVAQRALLEGTELTGDVRTVSVLFVDAVGSTELATRLPPNEIVAQLNRLLSEVVAATQLNDGLVNKFEGDGALCIFGAPTALGSDASAALRTARLIIEAVQGPDQLDIGIGISRGTVFAGDLGVQTRHEYTVIGDPVNEAARLTSLAKALPNRVLASNTVLEAATSDERKLWVRHAILNLRGREPSTATWTTLLD